MLPGAWAKFVVVAVDGAGRKGAAWRGVAVWTGLVCSKARHTNVRDEEEYDSFPPLPPDSPSLPPCERTGAAAVRRRARAASELEVGGRPPEEEGGIEKIGRAHV